MLHSWSYRPSTLSCSLCLRLEKNKYTFWFCWCFPPTGPMHLISALSLWAGYTSSKTWRSFSTPRLYQVKDQDLPAQTHWGCCQRRTLNCWANEKHGWYRIKRCRCQGPHLTQMTHLKKWTRWEVLFRRLKTLNPRRKVKSVVIHIYPFCIHFFLNYLLSLNSLLVNHAILKIK